jgi:type II secretory pathway pseudopilin PulG
MNTVLSTVHNAGVGPCLKRRPGSRRGFTIVELVIVITIILALFGLVLGAAMALQRKSMRSATQATVLNIAADLRRIKEQQNWPTLLGGRRLWDLNADGLLDGFPEKDFNATEQGWAQDPNVMKLPYAGYVRSAGYLGRADASGHPLDAFGFPLRVGFSVTVYGNEGWGVWSDGPDRIPQTSDDIFSWKEAE